MTPIVPGVHEGNRTSLNGTIPAEDTIPKEELALSLQRAVMEGDDQIGRGGSVWGYGGGGPIREALAEHFTRVRGVEVTSRHFMPDGGSGGAGTGDIIIG